MKNRSISGTIIKYKTTKTGKTNSKRPYNYPTIEIGKKNEEGTRRERLKLTSRLRLKKH